MGNKTKQQKKEPKEVVLPYVHVDTFLDTARVIYGMDNMQVEGFKAYMEGNQYQKGEKAFLPYLNEYLGNGGE